MQNEIEVVRIDLAEWRQRQIRKDVIRAARNLDGWLAALSYDFSEDLPADVRATLRNPAVNVLACTARAVETLRAAVHTNGV